MAAFLWLCFGMAIGFTIGALAPKRDDNFVTSVQKHLKPGQMISIAMGHYDVEDLDDGHDFEPAVKPPIPPGSYRFN